MRDNLSGSFQFNSGEDKQQILYGSDQTTCPSLGSREEEEPHYAEIAEVHAEVHKQLDTGTLPNPFTTLPMFESTTLVTNVGSTLGRGRTLPSLPPSSGGHTSSSQQSELVTGSPESLHLQTESTSLLSDSNLEGTNTNVTQMSRLSMSETSLTDEIMMALRDKLNDPNLYMSVIDAKTSSPTYEASRKEEDLYCSPLYSDPLQLKDATIAP